LDDGKRNRTLNVACLKVGDVLHLLPTHGIGFAAPRDEHGCYLQPPSISITLPEIFSDVRTGEKIWFDDGKIGGVVRSAVRKAKNLTLTKVSSGYGITTSSFNGR